MRNSMNNFQQRSLTISTNTA